MSKIDIIDYCGDCSRRHYNGATLFCETEDRETWENNPIPDWCPLVDEKDFLLTDDKLLYILKNAQRIAKAEYRNKPTWVFIMEIMSVGSTNAYKICNTLGIDPDIKAKNI